MIDSSRSIRRGVIGAACGVASAILFGISAPVSKLLLPRIDPWTLAGLLYTGAGVGLVGVRAVQRVMGRGAATQRNRLQRADVPQLLVIAVIGGGAGPVLMLLGLQRLSGVAGALLLNLEAVLTMLLAVTWFGERLTRGEAAAATIVIVGAAVVSVNGGPFHAGQLGVVAVAAACLAWAVDNNLTARLSGRNAVDLVQFKALTAGAGNLLLAGALGRRFPGVTLMAIALAVGFVSYGLSIVLDVYALRYVGAARESAFFASAPFAGALAAVPLLGERVGVNEVAGGIVMAGGIALLVRARVRAEATA